MAGSRETTERRASWFSVSSSDCGSSYASTKAAKRRSLETPGSVYLVSEDGTLLSLPIPSNSPLDPLNWSLRRRSAVFAVVLLFTAVAMTVTQLPGPLHGAFKKEFRGETLGPFRFDHLSSAPTLFMGVGCLIWLPLSLCLGRRTVFLFCSALLPLATLWAGAAPTFYQLIAAISLQGLANGVSVSTLLLTIIDITFIHQRPQAIAIFWGVGGALSQLILTFIPLTVDATRDWRPLYRAWSVPGFVVMVLVFFFVPETYFLRPPVAFNGRVLVQGGSEKIRVYDDWDALPGGKPEVEHAASPSPPLPPPSLDPATGTAPPLPPLPLPPTRAERLRARMRLLRLRAPRGGEWRSIPAFYVQTLMCLVNPLVFWVALLNGANFGGMMSIGSTYPVVLTQAPYNLSMRAVALVTLASSFGSLLAWPASGILISRLTQRMARRNGGVLHAEHLLPGFALPVLAGMASLVIYGVTVHVKGHFLWIYLAYGLNSFSYSGLSVANTLWVTEAFPRWAAAGLAVVGGVSYIASFGLSFVITPWIQSQGYEGTHLEIAGLMLVFSLIGVPVAFWGQNVRQFLDGRWAANEAGAVRPQ